MQTRLTDNHSPRTVQCNEVVYSHTATVKFEVNDDRTSSTTTTFRENKIQASRHNEVSGAIQRPWAGQCKEQDTTLHSPAQGSRIVHLFLLKIKFCKYKLSTNNATDKRRHNVCQSTVNLRRKTLTLDVPLPVSATSAPQTPKKSSVAIR